MNSQFTAIVKTLVAEQGKDALINPAKCKAFLADYAKGEFTKERRLLLRVIETGAAKEIDTAADLDICKKRQIRHLKEELFMAEDVAADVVDMLALVLRGAAPVVVDTPQANSLPDTELKPEKKRRRKKVKAQTTPADVQENKQEVKSDESTDTPLKYEYPIVSRIVLTVGCVVVIIICLYCLFLPGGILVIPFMALFIWAFKHVWKKTTKSSNSP